MTEKLIQSVERAIDILELFTTSTVQLSVKEISDKLGLSKSTAHGLIKTLEVRGLLEQDPENLKYKLGLKLFMFGNLVSEQMDIRKVAYPFIQTLVNDVKETVHLVVMDGKEAVYVEKVDGPGALRMYSQVGKRAPIHCTGVGKAIFAFLEDHVIDEILETTELVSFTPFTNTQPEEIKKNLQFIREHGYALDDEEIEVGLLCVAAPIFNHLGKAVASISCAGPKNRISNDRLDEIIEKVKAAGREISGKLGYHGIR